jgi:hypothetical protein
MEVCRFLTYSISSKLHTSRSDGLLTTDNKSNVKFSPEVKSCTGVRFIIYDHVENFNVVIIVFTLRKKFSNKLCLCISIKY